MRCIYITGSPRITALHTVFRQDCSKDFRFRGESHDFWELVCVVEGKVGVTADHHIFELEKGQAILHPPLQFHSVYSIGNTPPSIVVFTFSGEDIPPLQNTVCRIPDLTQLLALYQLSQKTFLFRHKIWILENPEEQQGTLQFVKQLELLLVQLCHSEQHTTLSQSARNYTAIVQALHRNIDRRLTVKELAILCNMSQINLQKTFSHYAGVGVMEYFNRIKMEQAILYLQQGHSVKETALMLGYRDQNYFSTAFKRITGHAPSRFHK